jgi:hypothetical protein
MKKSRKLACHVVNSNIAIGSLPTIQISLVIVPLFEEIYYGEPILSVVSNWGGCTIPLFQLSVYDVKSMSEPDTHISVARHYAVIWKQFLIANDRTSLR